MESFDQSNRINDIDFLAIENFLFFLLYLKSHYPNKTSNKQHSFLLVKINVPFVSFLDGLLVLSFLLHKKKKNKDTN